MDNAFAYDTALPNPSSNYTGISNVNVSNKKSVKLTAQWSLISYVKNFSYTGVAQTFTAPETGYYRIELWGAEGFKSYVGNGGKGSYVSGVTSISKNSNLFVYIGNQGNYTTNAWNGGGVCHKDSGTNCGSSGGGGVDIRTVSGSWNNASSLRSRIIVAGAGGGAGGGSSSSNPYTGYYTSPAAGGGLTGYSSGTGTSWLPSTGGSQIAGGYNTHSNTEYISDTYGAFGYAPQADNNRCCGAGGGSGWYGGGGGCGTSGGGGSSYISGHTGSVAVVSTSSSSPKSGCTTGTTNNACSISPYGYTFTNTVMIDGAGYKWTNTKGALTAMPNPSGGYYASGVGHSGNGYARITWLGDTI